MPQSEMESALRVGRGNDERWHRRQDGSCFWASGEMMPLKNDAGQPIGFLKILRDCIAQRLKDEDRLVAAKALEASEALKPAMLDAALTASFPSPMTAPSSGGTGPQSKNSATHATSPPAAISPS